jgi:hypothetical protein
MPRVTAREAERAILKDDWQLIPVWTLAKIVRQAGLTVDQFRKLL